MNSQRKQAACHRGVGAFASRDEQRIAAAFSDDAEWLAPKGNATALALPKPTT